MKSIQHIKERLGIWSGIIGLVGLSVIILMAVFGPLLTASLPLSARIEGDIRFPALYPDQPVDYDLPDGKKLKELDWTQFEAKHLIWAPFPFGLEPFQSKSYLSPLTTSNRGKIHWMGTDRRGRDVLTLIMIGARATLRNTCIATLIAGILGIFMGLIAGYSAGKPINIPLGQVSGWILGIIPALFYGGFLQQFLLVEAFDITLMRGLTVLGACLLIGLSCLATFGIIGKWTFRLMGIRRTLSLDLDFWIMRLIEILRAVPILLLLLSFGGMIKAPSMLFFLSLVALLGWGTIARITRGEVLKFRHSLYLDAAKSLGLPPWRILLLHLLPNMAAPLLVTLSFLASGVVFAESALSFLGLVGETLSWGGLIGSARNLHTPWWLVAFPGMAITVTVLCFHLSGEAIRIRLNPKLRSGM
ncbi:ABC transporter permease [Pontibacter sp. G13]|uniref:ABC transporter permease n=1 Tax=Pontibacter sp. G13 TaxID=3074898 RepID=UPI00288B0FA2|nr:ABC transporter permease [Pontibacter sp. G13]WNJ16907.1 ABC transporter permease [Pontibacter sp. G13]